MRYPIASRVSVVAWPSSLALPFFGVVMASLLAIGLFGLVVWQSLR